jgi:hypothetical protein
MCAAADSLVAESVHEESANAAMVPHESISAAVDGSVPEEEPAHAAAPVAAVAPEVASAAVDSCDSVGIRRSTRELHCLHTFLIVLAHNPTLGP